MKISSSFLLQAVWLGSLLFMETLLRAETSQEPDAERELRTIVSRRYVSRSYYPLTKVRSITGHETSGKANAKLIRISWADYVDGIGEMKDYLPNARDVSNACIVDKGQASSRGRLSDLVWAFGQFIDHDIDLTEADSAAGSADIECSDRDDPLFPFIPFTRSEFERSPGKPRKHVNHITACIDGSVIYGSDEERASALRSYKGGKMRESKGRLLPFNTDGFDNAGGKGSDLFMSGDIRVNEQLVLTALHTLFMREHNRLCERIERHYPDASDEHIYQLARKIVGAELQIITYNEFLPALLGSSAPTLEGYKGYDSSIDTRISTEFSTVGYRFGHSMLSPDLRLADGDSLPLRDAFFVPEKLYESPLMVDLLLGGITTQAAQAIDMEIVDDVRDFLFGQPGDGGLDLASLNIQRGRDHGIPGYNDVREAYGLSRRTDWDEISSKSEWLDRLKAVYKHPDEIDAWVGALAEDRWHGEVGELTGTILIEQFTRLRDGDPYFYLNDPDLQNPDLEDIIKLDGWGMADVLRANTMFHPRSGVFQDWRLWTVAPPHVEDGEYMTIYFRSEL